MFSLQRYVEGENRYITAVVMAFPARAFGAFKSSSLFLSIILTLVPWYAIYAFRKQVPKSEFTRRGEGVFTWFKIQRIQ